MAKTLRRALAALDVHLSHSQCLEITAQQLGFKDWNTAAASQDPQAAPSQPGLRLPFGWQVSGTQARDYVVGIDDQDPVGAATIRSLDKEGPFVGFATMMQSINARDFHDARVQLRAELKTLEVFDAATIWMRIDDAAGKTLEFDNMEKRATNGILRETQDWHPREIVLDVPAEAESIHYGFYLRGAGQCWARGFDLRTVAGDVAPTALGKARFDAPTNLNFEKAV